jgi:hypothetical protein
MSQAIGECLRDDAYHRSYSTKTTAALAPIANSRTSLSCMAALASTQPLALALFGLVVARAVNAFG